MIVYLVNDPERARPGPDEAKIASVTYLRGEDEPRSAFEARLMPVAIAHELQVLAISAESYCDGLYLDDLRDPDLDQTKCIEIGEIAPPR
jgi:hypothetical protein